MTAVEFYKSFNQSISPINISDQLIDVNITISFNIKANGIVLKNCTFKKPVIFEKIDLNCGIKFIDCTFESTLSINNCSASNYDNVFNLDGNHIEISNTKINGFHFNGNNRIERGVKICDKSVIDFLKITSLYCNKGSFVIYDSTIKTLFDVSQGNFSGSIEVREQSIIKCKVRFENVTAGSFAFTDSNFEKDVHIWAGKIGALIFNDGIFYDDLYIKAVPISGGLTIIGTEYKKSISFTFDDSPAGKFGSIKTIYIASGKFGEPLNINGSNSQISDVKINFSKKLEGAIYFNSCNLLSSKLTGDNYSGNLVFNHCNFNKLSLEFFYNYATISIISAKAFDEHSEIEIAHSNLGKTHFLNMFFNTFEKISVYNSVLTEIITSNVKWFDHNNLNPKLSPETDDYTYKREIYRQLKYALEKQGNKIESLKFRSLEISAFKSELFSKHRYFIKRIFNNDRFILWLGQTNNFGLNWFKPVLLFLGFSLLFYFLITIGVSEKLFYSINLSYSSFKITFEELGKYFYAYPQLMNPVHAIDRIFSDHVAFSFPVHLFDFLLKVFLAFFIFQIISAFRKFMK